VGTLGGGAGGRVGPAWGSQRTFIDSEAPSGSAHSEDTCCGPTVDAMKTSLKPLPHKLGRSVAAVALVLPLSVAAVATPAVAATTTLADYRGPNPPGYGYAGSAGYATPAYQYLDTGDATATQSTGLVEITTTLEYGEGEAAGTGIVIGSDGIVVTNHHVVEGATAITVTDVSTGQEYTADVVGYDAAKDVAVLRLENASGLATATTATGSLSLGDAVTAVGDAGGDGGSLTAAPGTVTDEHHPITVQDDLTGAAVQLRNLVEVSSDVVPGDSGGALLDADGDVVGMNVAASSGGADVTGYVIPIGRVLRVADAILAGDETASVVVGGSAFLGVQLSSQSSSPTVAGVVAGSPAEELGLAAGDTITAIEGTTVTTADGLRAAVAAHEPGDGVTVSWTDESGATRSGTATLVAGPIG
jgi:S1-C subfamily serine protease